MNIVSNEFSKGTSNLIFHRSKHVLKSSSNYAEIKDNSSPLYINWVRGHEILHGARIRVLKNEVLILRPCLKALSTKTICRRMF